MKRLDEKLARIRAGQYRRQDFIIADAKDPDMGPSLSSSGPKREPDGSWTRYRTPRGVPRPDPRHRPPGHRRHHADVGLQHRSGCATRGCSRTAPVKPAIRANDTTDIWRMRGATYHEKPSRPFRSASIPRTMYGTATPMPGAAITRHRPRPLLGHLQPRPRRRPRLARRRSPSSAPRPPSAASSTSSRCSIRTSRPGSTPRSCPTTSTTTSCAASPACTRPTGRSSSRSSTTAPRRWRS